MTTSTATQVLQDVIAVNLHFSIWTGRKMLEENDLSINGEAPPREVINLGSKHTTDPKALKVFHTLKRQAERLCLRVGIPFLGGYAIPTHKADDVAKELAKIIAKFEAEKDAYLLKHESIQDEWISKFPAYEQILRKALTPTEDVKNRINANFSMFQVQSAEHKVQSASTGLDNQVENLTGTLDSDILKSANKLLASLTGAIQPNQVNVRGLRDLREKVEGLAFLNGRFSKLVNKIKKVEGAMPITGKLSQDEINVLSGLLFRMSDESKLQALMSSMSDPEPTQEEVTQSEPTSITDSDFEFEADFDFDEPTTVQKLSNPADNSSFTFF
ncbi:DUF3150 domain-containing protein [Vibrio mediterranei]|uniref:DUF3150 domain-containing protein n=1 Tax=Vibrio mediterranei TaxID=689 RepID=UPI004067C193